jgi:hypothetical protein
VTGNGSDDYDDDDDDDEDCDCDGCSCRERADGAVLAVRALGGWRALSANSVKRGGGDGGGVGGEREKDEAQRFHGASTCVRFGPSV